MPDYTYRTIESLQHLHAIKAGSPELVRGGEVADRVLVAGVKYIEAHPMDEGDFGGPLNAALWVAYRVRGDV